jgi:hypothetical protein
MALTEANIKFIEGKLVTIVNDYGPIKGMEIPGKFIDVLISGPVSNPHAHEDVVRQHMLVNDIGEFDLPAALERLVKAGRIMEIEYCLPQMSYRAKSLFIAVGTEITWRWKDYDRLIVGGHPDNAVPQ